jgi:hypothetical protein
MANFISISGAAGSGKTTVTNYLHTYFHNEFYRMSDFSFAGPLKDALCLWFDWDRRRLDQDYGYKEGSTLDDGSPDPYCQMLGKTRRQIMQVFGTECMREGMAKDFWIMMADMGLRLNKITPADIHMVSDARMLNELEWMRKLKGYEIYIERVECERGEDPKDAIAKTLTKSSGHASEQEFLSWHDYDETIINLVDNNLNSVANMNSLTHRLSEVTIPAIRDRFRLVGKGKHDWTKWK